MAGLKFELDNARKDLRYYTHLAESLNVPSLVGESVHQSLALASALGYGGQVRAVAGGGAGAIDGGEDRRALRIVRERRRTMRWSRDRQNP